MLLVFFLVTSSMDSDKGLGRKMAPLDEQQQEQVDVNRSNVLQIAVQTARTTSYDAYFEMQNSVVAAYRTLRDKMAQQKYGRPFSQCTESERDVIRQRYPQRISEGMGSEE